MPRTPPPAPRFGLVTLVVLTGSGCALLASLAVRVLLARGLPPATLGELLLAHGVVTAVGGTASLGLHVAATRTIAASWGSASHGTARLVRRTWTTAAASGLVAALALIGSAPWLAATLAPEGAAPDTLEHLLRWLSPVALALPLGLAALGIERGGHGFWGRAVLRDGGGGVFRAVVVGLAAWLAGGPLLFAAALAAASLVSETAYLAFAVTRSRRTVPADDVPAHGVEAEASALGPRRLAPYSGMELLNQAYQWFDLILLGPLVGAAELALYGIARSLARSLDLIRASGVHGFLPAASAAAIRGSAPELRRLQRRSGRLVVGLLAGPAALLLLAPEAVLSLLFGTTYTAAGPLLRLLTLAVVVEAWFGLEEPLLLAMGRERQVLLLRTAAQVVALGILYWLAPSYGAVSACLAVLGLQVVRSTGLLVLRRRVLGRLGDSHRGEADPPVARRQ